MRELYNRIFSTDNVKFNALALEILRFQRQNNVVFADWLKINDCDTPENLADIPFLPIHFFKTHRVASFPESAALIFESSSTGGQGTSKHHVFAPYGYEQSFQLGFEHIYGKASNYCWLCLLPGYLERENSSLVYMANKFIQQGQPGSGFYLHEHEILLQQLAENEIHKVPTILLGVTFAINELSRCAHIPALNHTIIMETGGMKGRGPELTREELHRQWCRAFGVETIHSEYGMTELLSQAYSKGNGRFQCPPWMKVMISDVTDPGCWLPAGKTGKICVIDLANIESCSFIATEDLGKVHEDGSFEVLGRQDHSETRGCNLLVAGN